MSQQNVSVASVSQAVESKKGSLALAGANKAKPVSTTPVPVARSQRRARVPKDQIGVSRRNSVAKTPTGKRIDTSQLSTNDMTDYLSVSEAVGRRVKGTHNANTTNTQDVTASSKRASTAVKKKAYRDVRTQDEKTAQNKTEEELEYPKFLDMHYEAIHPGVAKMKYSLRELRTVIADATEIFKKEAVLVDVEPETHIVGDIHGQFNDLINIFLFIGRPPEKKFVFLGDYVDRGKMSIECIILLLAYKVSYPDHITLLRGNHECARVNRCYGFFEECVDFVPNEEGENIWAEFQRCFNMMPVSALIGTRILCMHGGLSPNLNSLQELRDMAKPIKNPSHGVVNDMLWSDPDMTIGDWRPSSRRSGFEFGKNAIEDICRRFDIDLIVRGHQLVLDGYWMSEDKRIVTLFSAPYYTNAFRNAGCVLKVDDDLACQFIAMVPESNECTERIQKRNRLWDSTVDQIPQQQEQ